MPPKRIQPPGPPCMKLSMIGGHKVVSSRPVDGLYLPATLRHKKSGRLGQWLWHSNNEDLVQVENRLLVRIESACYLLHERVDPPADAQPCLQGLATYFEVLIIGRTIGLSEVYSSNIPILNTITRLDALTRVFQPLVQGVVRPTDFCNTGQEIKPIQGKCEDMLLDACSFLPAVQKKRFRDDTGAYRETDIEFGHPESFWSSELLRLHFLKPGRTPETDPVLLRIESFKRYGPGSCFEFLCVWSEDPSVRTWQKLTDLLPNPVYMQHFTDIGWDINVERNWYNQDLDCKVPVIRPFVRSSKL